MPVTPRYRLSAWLAGIGLGAVTVAMLVVAGFETANGGPAAQLRGARPAQCQESSSGSGASARMDFAASAVQSSRECPSLLFSLSHSRSASSTVSATRAVGT